VAYIAYGWFLIDLTVFIPTEFHYGDRILPIKNSFKSYFQVKPQLVSLLVMKELSLVAKLVLKLVKDSGSKSGVKLEPVSA
jgi:hypothetical protein